jgi:hypothetical protein
VITAIHGGHQPISSRLATTLIVDRYIDRFHTGMHAADDETLEQEAQRLEGLPTSPAIQRMRAVVEGEQANRRDAAAVTDARLVWHGAVA